MSGQVRKVALVTGASSGIGVDLAREFARGGHEVILTARRQRPAGGAGHGTRWNRPGDRRRSGRSCRTGPSAGRGRADRCAGEQCGLRRRRAVRELPLERQMEIIQVNVAALTALTRLALPGMIARGAGCCSMSPRSWHFSPGRGWRCIPPARPMSCHCRRRWRQNCAAPASPSPAFAPAPPNPNSPPRPAGSGGANSA